MVLGLVLLASATALGAGCGLGAPAPPPFGVAISDSPNPQDPYLFGFNVTVASGAPTLFNWSFGDGISSNGSGSAFASPSHRFPGPGLYNVTVVVHEGTLSAAQSLPLLIGPAPLRVTIHVAPTPGRGPLTRNFTASIVGGSGSYPLVLWSFGDGGTGSGVSLQYTFSKPGHFRAQLNVTDSGGTHASVSQNVSLPTTPSSPTGPDLTSPAVIGSIVALAAVVLVATVVVVGRWSQRALRRDSIEIPQGGAATPTALGAPEAAAIAPPVPVPNGVDGGASEVMEPSTSSFPSFELTPPAAIRHEVRPEALRTSQRIVLHLTGLGALPPDEVAPVGFSQKGMAEALSIRQNALTNVLRRLVAGGVLIEDVRHVRGQPRRLKVYRLTARGEALARDLRRSSIDRPGTSPALRRP